MSALADIRIAAVPPAFLADVLPHAMSHLEKGLAVSNIDRAQLLVDLVFGRSVLWCVFDSNGMTAAFFTSLHEDVSGRFLMIYGFGGTGLRRWIAALQDRMEAYARAEHCTRLRFYGRPAWARVVPNYQPVADESGATIYERALA